MPDKRYPQKLESYQKLVNGQFTGNAKLTRKDCQELIQLISILQEENKEISSDLHSLYSDSKKLEE